MGELVVQLYMGLAQLFAGLFPLRFRDAARTGAIWRRVAIGIFVGLGSTVVGLLVAAFALAAIFVIAGVAIGIVRAFLS